MSNVYQQRTENLHGLMQRDGIDAAVFSDADSVYYFSGFANYLAMDFGRATVLFVRRGADSVLLTPAMEAEMAANMSYLDDIRPWQDGVDGEWQTPLQQLIRESGARKVGYEIDKTHPAIARGIEAASGNAGIVDVSQQIAELRVVKTDQELAVMRQAGQVAVAMVEAGKAALGTDVPEYEVALAIIAGGTRKAAEFLDGDGPDVFVAPTIYNLQVLQSGHHTCMVHRRASTRRLRAGDPVYMCFCGIANFKHFKLGFDREFWIGSVSDEHAKAYETVTRAQQAALNELRPGAIAADVHAAAEDVYRSAGYGASYRTGRGIGYSFLEPPELKRGDQTRLEAGMTFAVDGGLTVKGQYGARIGDSVAVTQNGFEYLTEFPRELSVV